MEAKELLDRLDVGVIAMAPIGRSPNGRRGARTRAAGGRVWVGDWMRSRLQRHRARAVSESAWPTASPAHSGARGRRSRRDRAGGPGHPGPGDHLTLAFRPCTEELAPESRAAQLLTRLEARAPAVNLQLSARCPRPPWCSLRTASRQLHFGGGRGALRAACLRSAALAARAADVALL